MKSLAMFILGIAIIGCDNFIEVDTDPPAAPRGIRTVSLDNSVELNWLANTEPDVDRYKIWVSNHYDGEYQLIGTTTSTSFLDNGANNGTTYYYALSAIDYNGNESELSHDVVYDTPRPEGFGVLLFDFRSSPGLAGYDFSSNTIGLYDDEFTDFFFEHLNGRFYLNVWNDTDIQDMGYTSNLDEISVAPSQGWSPSKYTEAIVGHTYVVWTWDNHYAKVRVRSVNLTRVEFDWAYQTAQSNPELKRASPEGGRRNLHAGQALSLMR